MNLSGKRLVIFGCGYVGRALAADALGFGLRVSALTRNPAKAAELRELGVEVIEADLADSGWHASLAIPVDFAVNTVSAAAATTEGYRHSYVQGARSILAWAGRRSAPVGTLVYTSSTGVYPQGGGVRVDEAAATGGGSPSGDVLLEAESLLRAAPGTAVTRTFVLRLAGIYGPSRHSLLDQLRAGAAVINGRGEHHLNLIHRDDVVAAIFACLAAGPEIAGDVFNVSDGAPAPKAEVVGWLAERLGRSVPMFDAASPSIRRGGLGVPDRVIDNTRIVSRLGWRPRFSSFREGYENILSR